MQTVRKNLSQTLEKSSGISMSTIIVVWVGLGQILYAFMPWSGFKWIAYMAPVMTAILVLATTQRNHLRMDTTFVSALVLYLVAVLLTMFPRPVIDYYFLRDFMIIAGAFFTFSFRFNVRERHIKILFLAYMFMVLGVFVSGTKGFSSDFNLVTSQGGVETSYAFVFGLFVIYFMYKKSIVYTLLAFLLLLLTFKRIGFLALLIVMAVQLVTKLSSLSKKQRRITLTALTALTCILATLAGIFFPLIIIWAGDTGGYEGDIAALSMGRVLLSNILYDDLQHGTVLQLLFGHGLGMSEYLLLRNLGLNTLPHNDYMKIIYEYGIFAGTLVFIAFWRVFSTSTLGRYFLIYTAIIFLTDNTLIYFFYFFPCYLMLRRRDKIT